MGLVAFVNGKRRRHFAHLILEGRCGDEVFSTDAVLVKQIVFALDKAFSAEDEIGMFP